MSDKIPAPFVNLLKRTRDEIAKHPHRVELTALDTIIREWLIVLETAAKVESEAEAPSESEAAKDA